MLLSKTTWGDESGVSSRPDVGWYRKVRRELPFSPQTPSYPQSPEQATSRESSSSVPPSQPIPPTDGEVSKPSWNPGLSGQKPLGQVWGLVEDSYGRAEWPLTVWGRRQPGFRCVVGTGGLRERTWILPKGLGYKQPPAGPGDESPDCCRWGQPEEGDSCQERRLELSPIHL